MCACDPNRTTEDGKLQIELAADLAGILVLNAGSLRVPFA
jgi:hypothetical protein